MADETGQDPKENGGNEGRQYEPFFQKRTKEGRIDDVLTGVERIRKYTGDGDYASALFTADNMPTDVRTGGLYSCIAISLAGELDRAEANKEPRRAEVLTAMLGYCRSKCGYSPK